MPRGRSWPQPDKLRVTVRYGRPLLPEEGEDVRGFRVRMAKTVSQLAAEEELGWYGALRAAADDALDVPGGAPSVRPGAVAVPAGEDDGNGGQVAHWRRIWASTQPLDDKRRQYLSTPPDSPRPPQGQIAGEELPIRLNSTLRDPDRLRGR